MINTNWVCERSSKKLKIKRLNLFVKNQLNIEKTNMFKNKFITMKLCSWNWTLQIYLKRTNSKK